MDESYVMLTVYFDDPFWGGVFERAEGRKLSAAKLTFGAEPKDHEVWERVLREYTRLEFSPTVDAVMKKAAANPKRAQREARRQMASHGTGTRSQQALQLQREANKLARQTLSRERRDAEKQRRFDQRQQKRKEKHRGR